MKSGSSRQEKIAIVCSISVLALAAWFWSLQVADVIEVLSLAYGD